MKTLPRKEIEDLSIYLQGVADAMAMQPAPSEQPADPRFGAFPRVRPAHKIIRAAQWLDKLSRNICSQGYVGCYGGENCKSDHK